MVWVTPTAYHNVDVHVKVRVGGDLHLNVRAAAAVVRWMTELMPWRITRETFTHDGPVSRAVVG